MVLPAVFWGHALTPRQCASRWAPPWLAGPLLGFLLVQGCKPATAQMPPESSKARGTPPVAAGASEPGARTTHPEGDAETGQSGAWPAWRGPRGDGHVFGAELPRQWPGELASAWRVALGAGWSSPVVAGNTVYLTDRRENQESLRALDLETGRERWSRSYPVDFEPHPVGRGHGNGPKSTPVVDRGRVYSVGIAGRLLCCDADTGDELWSLNYPAEFGASEPLPGNRARVNGTDNVLVPIGAGQGAAVPLFGYTGSPVAAEGKLICPVGGARGATIMAFDAATGRVAWRALDENVSYSSPVVAALAGTPQVVVMTGPRVVGLELGSGKLLWSRPFQIQYDESISTPVVAGDLVIVTADSRPLTAWRIERRGDTWTAEAAWQNDDLSSYLSSMVAHGDYLYGMADDGRWACVRLADGRTQWQAGDHGYYATALIAHPRQVLLGLNERGALAVLRASPEAYQLLAEKQLADTATWTVPAFVGRRVLVRSEEQLDCWVWTPSAVTGAGLDHDSGGPHANSP